MASSRDIKRQLEKAGWRQVRQAGSHIQFRHPDNPLLVTLPHPKKDLSRGLVRDIEKKTGLKF